MCGTVSAISSKSESVSGTPASVAIASRWRTVFVEPPRAMSTRIAFFIASSVTICRGVIPSRTSPTARSPVSRASRSLPASTAGVAAVPGSDIPSASVMQAIVFAVYSPWQEPHPGIAAHSSSPSSASLMVPAATCPTASKTEIRERSRPPRQPSSMGPPVSTIVGTLHRTAAISIPGTILSQVPTQTSPSKRWLWTITSIESAMFSREGSEYRIPSWPIAIPSQTPITPNSNGTPPPAATPSRTRSESWRRWTWPGTTVDQAFAIPMNGLSISAPVSPSDRRSDRFGARWYPTLSSSLRMVHWMRFGPSKAYGSPTRISPASASTVATAPSGRSAIGT